MSIKNSNDTIGNLKCDVPACNTVPQPAALPRALRCSVVAINFLLLTITLYFSVIKIPVYNDINIHNLS
jgi:hypothetical protein